MLDSYYKSEQFDKSPGRNASNGRERGPEHSIKANTISYQDRAETESRLNYLSNFL
jgi:hypothetical protein